MTNTPTAARKNINFAPITPSAPRTAADAPAGLNDADAQVWADGFNAALATNNNRYFVIWSGGSEADLGVYPFSRRSEAENKYDDIVFHTDDGESRVDLVQVTLTDTVTVIGTYCDKAEDEDTDEED